jgi:hypothetical protein
MKVINRIADFEFIWNMKNAMRKILLAVDFVDYLENVA